VSTPASTWTFYFDFISPYAFLGWRHVRAIARRHGRHVEPVPVLFAGLLRAHGTKGPAEVPAKRSYLVYDIARKAHRLGIAGMKPPPAHPFNPLFALRVASVDMPADARERVIDALFDAAWTKCRAIDTLEAVGAALADAEIDPKPLVAAATTPELKARLRERTDAVIKSGVFGVPTVVAEGELFWGTDSLEDLDRLVSGNMPPGAELAKDWNWEGLPAAATRKMP
jgi:2-hydroxychromene-2-carboxylate isomerase